MDDVTVNEWKATCIFKEWDFGAKDLVRDAAHVVKVGSRCTEITLQD